MRKRIFSLLLVCCLCVATLTITAVPTLASTGGHSRADAVAWANSQVGQALDYDGYYGAQCVDLTCYYYVYLGQNVPWGNAEDYVNGGSFTPSGWTYQSSPQPGDIAVDSSYSPGHVAIVVGASGSQVTIVEQQYNGQEYCTSRQCSAGLFNTFIRPDFSSSTAAPTPTVSASFAIGDRYSVGKTNAVLATRLTLSGAVMTQVSRIGVYLYDGAGKQLTYIDQDAGIDRDYNYLDIWYDVNSELYYTLSSGTNYKYKFFAVIGGKTYWSDEWSFKTGGPTPAPEYSILLNRSSLDLTVGDSATLSATVSPAGTAVSWTSSNTSVATVSNGKVTAVAAGTAIITAKVGDKTATCTVNVSKKNVAVTGVSLSQSSLTLKQGESALLSATVNPSDATDKTVTWGSSNLSVASVSNGMVTAVAEGTATITASAGGKSATCTVTVQKKETEAPKTNQERESNDSMNTANSIPLNTEIIGALSNRDDVDWYAFTLPADGMITISFSHEYVESSRTNYWVTTLFTAANKELLSSSWNGTDIVTLESLETGLPAGTYYLRVKRDWYSGLTYHFTVNYAQSDSWEKELNDTVVTPNTIPLNTEISGALSSRDDVDWYAFTLPADGMITISFSHEYVESSRTNYWVTTLFTAENKELLSSSWNGTDIVTLESLETGLPAGTYYLRVKRDWYSGLTYHFTVSYTQSDLWEKEPNDTVVTPNTIPLNTEISGALSSRDDVDWYAFTLPADGMITISFSHEYVESSRTNYWVTTLFTAENKELLSSSWNGTDIVTLESKETGLSAGAYYLRIKRDWYSGLTYHFSVNSESAGKKDVPVTGITISQSTIELKPGDNATLTASISPANATNKDVIWSSSNTSVATVSNGKVIAVAAGTATITASAGDKSASCTVTVKSTEGKPSITSTNLPNGTVGSNYSYTLSANGTAPITWQISSGALPGGLSLNTASGLISGTPTKAGTFSFIVTAKNSAGTGEATLTIKVSEKKTEGSEVHFERVMIYYQDQFTDVPADQWYTGSVANAFELGLMRGNSSDTFNPYGDVTVAEAITMAARIHSIYSTGTENFDQSAGGVWYQTYLDYALANGIISRAYYNSDVTHKASRAQFAEIFANSLPAEALAAMNSVADNAIPDVKMTDSFAEFVYKLYRAGILTGSDANGTFNPQTFITRAEAAAIVSRMAESNNRVSITLS